MTKRFASLLKKALILCCAAGTLASCAIPGVGLREADADPFFDFSAIRDPRNPGILLNPGILRKTGIPRKPPNPGRKRPFRRPKESG